MNRKFLSILLTLCMVFSLLPMQALALTPPVGDDPAFTDTSGHWAEDAIGTWAANGVLNGDSDGEFRPNAPISRAELAAVLNRVIGYTETADIAFTDVPSGAWYYSDVAKLCTAGIMTGDGAGTLRPTANITREEAVVLIARAFDVPENAGNESPFPDAGDISGWASFLVDGMKAAGYISGDSSGRFNPKASITRAEVVTILDSMVSGYYAAAGEYSGDVTGNVVISAADVTLKDMKISGDLYIMEGVGDGDVTLENVEVAGKTFVRGGGPNSLYIKSCTIAELICTKDEIHVVLSGGTKIIVLRSFVEDGNIELLNCTVETVTVMGDGLNLKLDANSAIETLNADADSLTVTGEKGAVIDEANLNGKTAITGDVKVKEAAVNIDGCTIETKPDSTTIKDGVSAEIAGKEQTGGQEPASPAPSGGGGGPVTPAPAYSGHNIPNKTDVPYKTAFAQLALPVEATLSATGGSPVTVSLTWDETSYSAITVGLQTVTASVAAKTGTLPAWAPSEISVTVTVLPMPTPTTLDITFHGFTTAVTEDTIAKGDSGSYALRVKDEHGTIMTQEQLDDAGVTWTIDNSTGGIDITRNNLSVTVSVAAGYAASQYVFTPMLTYTANGGGSRTATVTVATPAPPAQQVAAVSNIHFVVENEGRNGACPTPYVRFTAPSDVSGILCFSVTFTNTVNSEHTASFSTLDATANHLYNFGFFDTVQYLPAGDYEVTVTSIAQGSNQNLNNGATSDYTLSFSSLGSAGEFNSMFVQEAAIIEGIYENFVSLVIDYHYVGALVPDTDLFYIDAYFDGPVTRYAPSSTLSHVDDGKGRLYSNVHFQSGETIDLTMLRVHISRYSLRFDELEKVLYLSASAPIDIFNFALADENGVPVREYLSYHSATTKTATGGTPYDNLNLPESVQLSSNYARNMTVNVQWSSEGYDPSSTAPQTLRGTVIVDPSITYPAWIPEYIETVVTLS